MKVLHLPTDTAGVSGGLVQGERDLGLESESLVVFGDYVRRKDVTPLFDLPPKTSLEALYYIPALLMKINEIKDQYDIFHFNISRSIIDNLGRFTSLLDLPLYKHYGKIAVTFNGCDARMRSHHRTLPFSPCSNPKCANKMCLPDTDAIKRARIKKWDKYAGVMFAATPDLLAYLPDRAVYLPNTTTNWDELIQHPILCRDKIRLVHARTNQLTKGSEYIESAATKLQELYPETVEYIRVEKRTNEEARHLYSTSDIIIDQLALGTYGVLALEGMKMGKPVVAYLDPVHYTKVNKEMTEGVFNSIINANPHTIFNVLESLIKYPDMLEGYRKNGLKFVERWHSPKAVATIAKREYCKL
jgi:hypothetical protein